jgi:hypothetical protein
MGYVRAQLAPLALSMISRFTDRAFTVRRRLISTSLSSAMSTPANRRLLDVSLPQLRSSRQTQFDRGIDLIYKCGGIDKRTIEKFEKVRLSATLFSFALLSKIFCNRWNHHFASCYRECRRAQRATLKCSWRHVWPIQTAKTIATITAASFRKIISHHHTDTDG